MLQAETRLNFDVEMQYKAAITTTFIRMNLTSNDQYFVENFLSTIFE